MHDRLLLYGLAATVALICSGLYIAMAAWLAWWMMEPINRVAGKLRATTQFMLADFLALMVMLQIALGLLGTAIDTNQPRETSVYWTFMALAILLVLTLWTASVCVVSRAGIARPLRRLIVTLVLIPGTLATIMAIPSLVIVLIGELLEVRQPRVILWTATLGFSGLVAAVILVRRLSFWVLVGSPGGEALATITNPTSLTQRLVEQDGGSR